MCLCRYIYFYIKSEKGRKYGRRMRSWGISLELGQRGCDVIFPKHGHQTNQNILMYCKWMYYMGWDQTNLYVLGLSDTRKLPFERCHAMVRKSRSTLGFCRYSIFEPEKMGICWGMNKNQLPNFEEMLRQLIHANIASVLVRCFSMN